MGPEIHEEDLIHPVAALLIANRETQDWGKIATVHGDECTKEIANEFLLCCLIDYQSDADEAWNRGHRYFEGLNAEHRRELWKMIADTPKVDWASEENFRKCGLHRWHRAHIRLWQIANDISVFFDGDARKVWRDSTLFDVLCRTYYIGAGEQISRMIVGALKDCGHISGKSDVKADVHICRVLGRVFDGKETTPVAAVKRSREIYPADPWQLDSPLWSLGQSRCHSTAPECTDCYLATKCRYRRENS